MTDADISCLHNLNTENIPIPERFTNPFRYHPHPWVVQAAQHVSEYLSQQTNWQKELSEGKMLGVLIVQYNEKIGFLAAYSGNLANRNDHPYFVPAVYDLLRPNSTFKKEEKQISAINTLINHLEKAPERSLLIHQIDNLKRDCQTELTRLKLEMKISKEKRNKLREESIDENTKRTLIHESQQQRADYKRAEQQWKNHIIETQNRLDVLNHRITELKKERRQRSAALQQYLFQQFRLLNANGCEKNLCEIFKEYNNSIPPAGSGECAAPKLLQYAFKHGMKPLAMGEFWWGHSPTNELRRHGSFYPSCKSKCEPILHHMLQGLNVEKNTSIRYPNSIHTIKPLYEDDSILAIQKPIGMLSVRGKENTFTVQDWAEKYLLNKATYHIVHRLDMDTSGILILCKTKEAHRVLQEQFENQIIRKKYVAWLDGVPQQSEGIIRLPLSPDIKDRPRQQVDTINGKPAITHYRVINSENGKARVELFPLTGRTHQLRVHCAHKDGLDCPIMGDCLYGSPGNRLYLHAVKIEFIHPQKGTWISLECEPDF